MNQLPKKPQNSSQKNTIMIVAILMGIGIVVLATLVFLLFRQSGFQLPSQATPISSPTPVVIALTEFVPTVECNSQTVVIGSTTFKIQSLTPGPDGSFTVPADSSGVAYWLETTEGNTLIVLSPTPENISLQTTLTAGNTAKITWEGCNSKMFNLSAPEPNPVNISSLPSQLTPGLTIFFETDTSGNGLIVRGDVTEIIFP
jgi:hypothetical protein